MSTVKEFILLFVGAAFVNNVVLSQFLGICPFLGVSKRTNTDGVLARICLGATEDDAVNNDQRNVDAERIVERGQEALNEHIGNIVRKSGSKRMRNGSTATKSAFAGRNRPDPRELLLRNRIHINLLHEPQSRKALRKRGVSLHLNGKRYRKSKTLFVRKRVSTSRTP